MPKPLSGLRVLDLSRVLAGPWTTQMLADLGAEVIKVERPGAGDDTRAWGPPYADGPTDAGPPQSAYFLGANRGKRSVAVDLKHPDGARLVRDLAMKSDVLIENFKVGDMARYGLDPDSLHPAHPGLIYCSITGFGQTGPRREQAGYDLMIQAMGGLMSITGQPDDRPGGGPVKVGVALVDVLTGLNAAVAILAALHERHATGRGTVIDLALFDVCTASLANQAMNWLVAGRAPGRMGNQHPSIAPYQSYEAADGFIILAVGNDRQFRAFCQAAGLDTMADDERFVTNASRVANRDALTEALAPVLRSRTRADWIDALTPAGVPCGPINDVGEVFADPQAKARDLATWLPHASLGRAPTVRNPIRFDGEPVLAEQGPPILGQDTGIVLKQVLGLSDAEMATFIQAGVVAVAETR